MPSAEEKQRRKQMVQQLQANATEQLLASLPLSLMQLKGLFNFLDSELSETACDDTLQLTEQFATESQVNFESLKKWLGEHGGYCDCEVLANVEERFEGLL